MKHVKFCVFSIVALVVSVANAVEYVWNLGSSSVSWFDKDVWLVDSVPTTWTNDAGASIVFPSDGEVVTLNEDIQVEGITTYGTARIVGSGALNVHGVHSSGWRANLIIEVPTYGELSKTHGGRLTLAKSRTDRTALINGSLAMLPGATLDGSKLVLGASWNKVLFDYGGQELSLNFANAFKPGNDVALANGAYIIKDGYAYIEDGSLRVRGDASVTCQGWICVCGKSRSDESTELDALLEIDGGAVTNSKNIAIGDYGDIGSKGAVVVKNGGECYCAGNIYVAQGAAGSLTIDGGKATAAGYLALCREKSRNVVGEDGCVSVTNGGVVSARTVVHGQGAGNGYFNFDGGTLKAAMAGNLIEGHDNLFVNVGVNGGIIDNGGFDVTVGEDLLGDGAITNAGAGVITYAVNQTGPGEMVCAQGETIVAPGCAISRPILVKSGAALGLDASGCVAVECIAFEKGAVLNFNQHRGGIVPLSVANLDLPESGAVSLSCNGGEFSAGIYAILAKAGISEEDTVKFDPKVSPDTSFEYMITNNILYLFVDKDKLGPIWTGAAGDGRLTTAENWLDGCIPQAGDALDFRMGISDIVVNADMNDVVFGTILTGASVITVDGVLDIQSITNEQSIAVGSNSTVVVEGDMVFDADGTQYIASRIEEGGMLKVKGRIIAKSKELQPCRYQSLGCIVANGLVNDMWLDDPWRFRLTGGDNRATRWVIGSDGVTGRQGFWMFNSALVPYADILPLDADFSISALVGVRNLATLTLDTTGMDGLPHTIDVSSGFVREGAVVIAGSGVVALRYDIRNNPVGDTTYRNRFSVVDTATLSLGAGSYIGDGSLLVESGAAISLAESDRGTATFDGTMTIQGGASIRIPNLVHGTIPLAVGSLAVTGDGSAHVEIGDEDAATPTASMYTLLSARNMISNADRLELGERTASLGYGLYAPDRKSLVMAKKSVDGKNLVVFDLGGYGTRVGGGELLQYVTPGGSAIAPDVRPVNGKVFVGWACEFDAVSEQLVVHGVFKGAPIDVGGPIYENETWDSERDIVVTNDVIVQSGVTLTIEAGTTVKFADGIALRVEPDGSIVSAGTRARPVVFTSLKDDSWGGDDNMDGNATYPGLGDWGGVIVHGGRIDASYTQFLYGGGVNGNQYGARACCMVWNDGASGDFTCCRFAGSAMDGCFARDSVFRNCIFEDNDRGLVSAQSPIMAINCVAAYNRIGLFAHTAVLEAYNCISSLNTDAPTDCDDNVLETDYCYFGDDPCFWDAERGDYRITEESPCIDAGSGDVAPAVDYYGQKRQTILTEGHTGTPTEKGKFPDIGIYEVLPRTVQNDIDFAAVSVSATGPVSVGDEIEIAWTIQNLGSEVSDGSWRDTVSLVSANGRVVSLGEKVSYARLHAGDSIVCTGTFIVPVLEEGNWYPKVQVNTYRDVFEGTLTENNSVTGAEPVEVAIAETDISSEISGQIVAGVPTVLKLPFSDDATNRLVRIALPEGVSASWGFGFMPTSGRTGGSPVQSGGGISAGHDVCFLAPDGEHTVYVVLESNSTADYSLTLEEFALRIDSVSPSVVKYGEKRFVIATGTGFTTDTKLILSAGAYSEEVACSILSSSEMMFYLDATRYTSGTIVHVKAQNGTVSSLNDGVVTIVDSVGEGNLKFELNLPETARAKRISVGYIEYGNVGNADMVVPILNIVGNDGTVVSLTSHSGTFSNSCTIVGVSMRPPHGMLKAGEMVRLPFYFIPGEEYSISLEVLNADNVVERDSVFPTWKSYCEGMAEAVTRECVSGHLVYDFQTIYNRAMRMAYEQDSTSLSGFLYNLTTSLPMVGETLLLTDTNYTVIATTATDADGYWTFRDLPMNETYEVVAKTCNLCTQNYLVSGKNAGAVRLMGMPLCTFSLQVNNLANCDLDRASLCAIDQNGTITLAHFTSDGKAVFSNMADGVYDLAFKSDDWCCITGKNEIVISVGEVVSDNHVGTLDILPSGSVNVSIVDGNNSCVFSNVVCSLIDAHGGILSYGITDQNGSVRFDAPPGSYDLVMGTKVQRLNDDKIEIIGAFSAESVVPASVVPFVIDSSVGEIPLKTAVALVDDGVWGTNFTCEWDFDGDGVVDSSDISPTNVYTEAGTYSIGLRVTTSNGRVFNYQKRDAVMAWEALPTKMADGAFTIDDNSGYKILDSNAESMALQRMPDRDVIILGEGDIIVDPAYPLMPRRIKLLEETDFGKIIIQTEYVELTTAYQSLSVSAPLKLLGAPEISKETYPFDFANVSLGVKNPSLFAKGTLYTRNGRVNLWLLDGEIKVFQLILDFKLSIDAGMNVHPSKEKRKFNMVLWHHISQVQ